MANVNKYGDITPRQAAYSVRTLLPRGQSRMCFERVTQITTLPAKETDSVKWRRYESFQAAIAPMNEVIPKEGQTIQYTDITATLELFGDRVNLTRKITDHHEDNVIQEESEVLGEQAADTAELIRFGKAKAGTSVYYANGAASRVATQSPPTNGDLHKILRAFNRSKARPITKVISASDKISTEPVADSYLVIGHTDLLADLKNLPNFVPVEQYSNNLKALPNEVGKKDQFRFLLTELAAPWLLAATSAGGTTYLANGAIPSATAYPDVYPLLFFAQNAFGGVAFKGKDAIHLAVRNPETIDSGNPFGQVGFVSWWFRQAAAILNEAWIIRLECCCTATPS